MSVHSKHEPTSLTANVSFTIHPEDRQAFLDAVLPHIETAGRRDGCVYYQWGQDLLDPNTFHLSEAWRDRTAMEALHADESFQAVMRAVRADVRIVDYQAEGYEIASQMAFDAPPTAD